MTDTNLYQADLKGAKTTDTVGFAR